jgi:hypothetical protein
MSRFAIILLAVVILFTVAACSEKGDPVVASIKDDLMKLKTTYDTEVKAKGTSDGLTLSEALEKAGIGDVTQLHWDFEVLGNPPKRFMATSTSTNQLGEGKKIWYDSNDEVFHGYSVDEE